MKTIKLLNVILLLTVIISLTPACSEDEDESKLTYEMFQNSLSADMNYDAIVATFGEPDSDVGSGIHIYVYKLNDATEMHIGYTYGIMYALHLDSEGNLLHTLISS